jgi:hypothetical protein
MSMKWENKLSFMRNRGGIACRQKLPYLCQIEGRRHLFKSMSSTGKLLKSRSVVHPLPTQIVLEISTGISMDKLNSSIKSKHRQTTFCRRWIKPFPAKKILPQPRTRAVCVRVTVSSSHLYVDSLIDRLIFHNCTA